MASAPPRHRPPSAPTSPAGRFRRWIEADPNNKRGFVVAVLVVIVLVMVLAARSCGSSHKPVATQPACGPLVVGSSLPDGSTLTDAEVSTAKEIYGIVMASGIDDPTQAAVVALDAAWTETRLRNLSVGDRDSVGWFQERPSEGWGTPREIIQPDYQTHEWLHHLENIDGWANQDPATVAQKVEVSGYPDRYEPWAVIARTQVLGMTGPSTTCGGGTVGSLSR